MTIETGPLGRTGAHVTVLGYGAMELRGQPWGPRIEDQEAGRLLGAVLGGGISLIDTSIDYGRSEELIGKYLGHRRDEYFLASKCGCLLGDPPAAATPPFPHDYGAGNVRAGVEQSLRRLCTDRLDLVQVHMSPSRAQLEAGGTVEALLALREEGKIRFTGMSGILPQLPDHIAMGVFDVFQIPYSAVQREHEDLITAAARPGTRTGGRDHSGCPRGRGSAAGRPRAWRTCWAACPGWNSCCASRSATRPCPAPSSAPPAWTTCAPTWPSPGRARCRRISTTKPGSASRQRPSNALRRTAPQRPCPRPIAAGSTIANWIPNSRTSCRSVSIRPSTANLRCTDPRTALAPGPPAS